MLQLARLRVREQPLKNRIDDRIFNRMNRIGGPGATISTICRRESRVSQAIYLL